MADIKFNIVEDLGSISSTKKVLRMSWGDSKEVKTEIRTMSEDGRPLKGIGIKDEELEKTIQLLEISLSGISSEHKHDSRPTVDLMSMLSGTKEIVDNRLNGSMTKDGMVIVKLKQKTQIKYGDVYKKLLK